MTYQVYVLRLPSGGCVEVRKPDAAALLGGDHLLFPLLAAVGEIIADETLPQPKEKALDMLRHYCEATLVKPRMPHEVKFEEIPYADVLAIVRWATTGEGQASKWREAEYRQEDFLPLVRGSSALFLDLVCSRYHQRPSTVLGLTEAAWGVDLDMAIAVRGMRKEGAGHADEEVEVEDMFGRKHRVPRKWLPEGSMPAEARVRHADRLLTDYGDVPLSVGGEGGDARIGPMPSAPGSLERSGYT